MNYLADRLNYLEEEEKKTKSIMSSFVSKKEKPKVKSVSKSVEKVLELHKDESSIKLKNTNTEVKIRPLKSIEITKSKPVIWL